MELSKIWNNEELGKVLKENGIAVMPTDTIYGIVGKAEDKDVVERIYKIRKRSPEKPCIILTDSIAALGKFSIILSEKQKKSLEQYWPGPVSIIFDCLDEELAYLHRGTKTLGFRVPSLQQLRDLLTRTGPLLAPSANFEGLTPVKNIQEAKEYFGDSVDLYVDGVELANRASKVIKLHKDGSISIIRE